MGAGWLLHLEQIVIAAFNVPNAHGEIARDDGQAVARPGDGALLASATPTQLDAIQLRENARGLHQIEGNGQIL